MAIKEIVRLITAKSVLGGAPPDLTDGVKYLPLFRVYGTASATKTVKGAYGDDGFKLVGTFEATNISTGESVTGPMLILPPPMNDVLAAEVNARGPGAGGLSFAFEVGIKPGAKREGKARQAYEWVTKNLIPQEASDPLASLRSAVLALPAPETETGKAGK